MQSTARIVFELPESPSKRQKIDGEAKMSIPWNGHALVRAQKHYDLAGFLEKNKKDD